MAYYLPHFVDMVSKSYGKGDALRINSPINVDDFTSAKITMRLLSVPD